MPQRNNTNIIGNDYSLICYGLRGMCHFAIDIDGQYHFTIYTELCVEGRDIENKYIVR